MLGNSFFELAQQLAAVGSFSRVVELIDGGLAALTGSTEIMMVELDGASRVLAVHGKGARAEALRGRLDKVNAVDGGDFWKQQTRGKLAFALADASALQVASYRKYLATLFGRDASCDLLGGQLFYSAFRSVRLLALRNEGFYQPGERDAFDVTLLIARTALERVCLSKHDSKIRERVMMARREATLGIFTIDLKGIATPVNPGGVQCTDRWWNADETEFQLDADAMQRYRQAMAKGWKSPTSPQWTPVELNLGGGSMTMDVLPQANGEGVVMFSPPPATESIDSGVPMLTRRQCEIMEWIAEGKTSSEVATILGISPRTVEKHLEAVFQRMGVENRVGAVRRYLELKGS